GIVTLSGLVDNIRAKDRSRAIAETVRGVRSVVNTISVNPRKRSDTAIERDIAKALLYDPATESFKITVNVDDGVATLKGKLESWTEKRLAESVTKGVDGIVAVKNELLVKPQYNRSDDEIKAEIERALQADVWIDSMLMKVSVKDGDVHLSGAAGSAAERTRAYNASWINGVKSVDNSDLEVKWWARERMQRKSKVANISDVEIKRSIKDAFLYDLRVHSYNPDIAVDNGVVTLSGEVHDLAAKRAAEQDARNTFGVVRVNNYLRVRPKILLVDADLIERVDNRLTWDADLEANDSITPVARNGEVSLYGTVDTYFEKWHAEDVTSRVGGVVAVKNYLTVRERWAPKPDPTIKAEIDSELYWSPFVDSDEVKVTVNAGTATLKGTVDTWRERFAAVENAYEGGARVVNDQIKVNQGARSFLPSYSPYQYQYYG
ncbi:MAG: BON domain-containing protein, partial [Bdellovibrionales bacterium]|nr:BON domain-containing protein [Bdellovibrionales bacterium]